MYPVLSSKNPYNQDDSNGYAKLTVVLTVVLTVLLAVVLTVVQSVRRRALERGRKKGQSGIVRTKGKLRGGVGDGRVSKLSRNRRSQELLLTNRESDCFVNSTLKLVFHTDLPTYFRSNLPSLIRSRPNQDLTVSQQLLELTQSRGEYSTGHVRTEVALKSGMNYLDNNQHEDALDFLIALNTSLKMEMGWNRWEGKLRIEKRFRTGENGVCEKCENQPEGTDEGFLTITVDLPMTGTVALSTLIKDHLYEEIDMKCSWCCPHLSDCDLKGECSLKPATKVTSLIEAPEYLFVQLKRYMFDDITNTTRKVHTMVSFSPDETFQFNSEHQFKVVGVVNHHGESAHIGHYTAFLRNRNGLNSWTLHNDNIVSPAKFNDMKTNESYIFLLKKLDSKEKNQNQVLHNFNQILIADDERPKQNSESTDAKKDEETRTGDEIPDVLDVQIKDLEQKPNKTAEDKKELRKLKMRRNKRNQRKRDAEKETESQKEERKADDRVRKQRSRKNESEDASRERLNKDKLAHQQSRVNESEDARRERLEKDRLRHHAAKTGKTSLGRLKSFNQAVRWGPSFPCINCHQTLTGDRVIEFDSEIKEKLEESCSAALSRATIKQNYNSLKISFKSAVDEEGDVVITMTSEKETAFICRVCFNTLKEGKFPPKSSTNCLAAVPVPEDLLPRSYLEEALLARVLVFIKIFSLKTSLMPAMKDKCIVIPLERGDVYNTVESMPRLPSEAGIIDIQWKRRMAMRNVHLQAKVDPDKLFRTLKFLKACGNPHYQDSQTREEYEARCQAIDPIGYNLIFGEDKESGDLFLKYIPEAVEPIYDIQEYRELLNECKDDREYREEDVVRKHQLDYNETLCMVEKYPEAFHVDGVIQHGQDFAVDREEEEKEDDPESPKENNKKGNQLHIVAPGEGKTPKSLIFVEDWDAKAFWALHPDGKNNLTDKRRRKKLSDLEYFKQRLNNVDPRWRRNTHWVFSAAVFRENIDFQRNIDLG